MALGVTQTLPVDDKHNYDRKYLEDQIVFMLGGRVAEELVLKCTTTGAGNDLERVTELARKMVTDWGMSPKIGPLTFGKKDESVFLGKEFGTSKEISEKTAVLIDEEIMRIVKEAHKRATKIVSENKNALIRIAEALLKYEAIDASDIKTLIAGKKLDKKIEEHSGTLKEKRAQKKNTRRKDVNIQDNSAEGAASA
jgi:cell division protease FtsH